MWSALPQRHAAAHDPLSAASPAAVFSREAALFHLPLLFALAASSLGDWLYNVALLALV